MRTTHTFISKSNTIIDGSLCNTGLNPILSLYYGKMHTRALIYFDIMHLKSLVENKTYPDMSKLKHVLKFWNVSDINLPKINCPFPDNTHRHERERASSFELVLFTIPEDWDAGRGFDYTDENPMNGKASYSEFASNWFYAKTDKRWGNPGIYPVEFIEEELENPESNIIVARQRFDFGNEQLEVDITDTVNKFIDGTLENHGLCIAFAPAFEETVTVISQYAGFFSNRTNTFFEPYLETTYTDTIMDDRMDFFMDKLNRLYFYANFGGDYVNLDELPVCTINGSEMPVKQATKGIYYTEITLRSTDTETGTMIYDTWSNIKLNGIAYPDVELYTTTKAPSGYMTFGLPFETEKNPKFTPSLYGINENETIKQGDIRKVTVDCRINYTVNQAKPLNKLQYRIYVKTADRQVDVISWSDCDRMYGENCFYVDTKQLLPHKYYMDIKVTYGSEEIITRNLLSFNIANDGRKSE